ncbi:hypothetical protein A5657_02980 [Mycobacterium kubicae]|nr:hypothetical protein A5657_02980 [Mycobacterium kubicae]
MIYGADIGSVRSGNFGWARLDPEHGDVQVERQDGVKIAALVDAVAYDLDVNGRCVALGFECPLFVPVPDDPLLLGAARVGEGNRPFAGGPGTAALVTGLVQTAWILRELRQRCSKVSAYLDWKQFTGDGQGLFLWEAFVTGKAKAASHVDDALVAATTFRHALPDVLSANAVQADRPLSLLGAALLWSGWSSEVALLHEPCLVIKSEAPEVAAEPVTQASPRTASPRNAPLHVRVSRMAEQIPAGSWTTYGDIGEAVGAIAIAVGGVLAAHTIPNAHRILNAKGRVAKNFAFSDGRTEDPVEMLKSEGIRFINGRADSKQRWHPT